MKEKFLFVILLLGIFSVVSAAESEISTTFTVGGCDIPGSSLGLPKGYCSYSAEFIEDNLYGEYYCQDIGTSSPLLLSTSVEGLGCSMGVPFDSFLSGSLNYCCPDGYHCADGDYGYICVINPLPCSTFGDETECDGSGYCFWMENTGECISPSQRSDYSCEYYDTQTECEDDDLEISSYGVGSEIIGEPIECAGIIFSVSRTDLKCSWNGTDCSLNTSASKIYDADGLEVPTFSWSTTFSLGDCIDGEQDVNTECSSSTSTELTQVQLDECLDAVGCTTGTVTRFCGEASIKLPGFSFLSFALSFALIAIFYFMFYQKALNNTLI